jgi:hypothetical protein
LLLLYFYFISGLWVQNLRKLRFVHQSFNSQMLGDADSLIYLILPWQQILLVVTTVIESIIFVMDCHIGHVCDGVHN